MSNIEFRWLLTTTESGDVNRVLQFREKIIVTKWDATNEYINFEPVNERSYTPWMSVPEVFEV